MMDAIKIRAKSVSLELECLTPGVDLCVKKHQNSLWEKPDGLASSKLMRKHYGLNNSTSYVEKLRVVSHSIDDLTLKVTVITSLMDGVVYQTSRVFELRNIGSKKSLKVRKPMTVRKGNPSNTCYPNEQVQLY